MARPASRAGPMAGGQFPGRNGGPVAGGGYVPQGAGGPQGGVNMRQASIRQGTAAAMRPGSGMRLGTAQQRAASGQASVGLSTDVDLQARPVTQQGLSGMGQQNALGPGRQIADKSYYLTELRNKVTDITNEIQRLNDESVRIDKDRQQYSVYERRYESMIAEVRKLEGQLADFNLALDKLRTNTELGEISESCEKLKGRNDYERKQIDEVFVKATKVQKASKFVEAEIAKIHGSAAARMEALGEDVVADYTELQEEEDVLTEIKRDKDNKIAELENQIKAIHSKLDTREYQIHAKGIELEKQKGHLMVTKRELEEETSTNLSPEDMKAKLLDKVKTANNEISNAEKRIKEYEDALDEISDKRRDKEQELTEAKKHAQKAKKYEAVYQRDAKMQEFITKFPESLKAEEGNKGKLKQTVVALLKHISKQLAVEKNLPDVEQLAQMRGELSFKEQKMKNSKNTLNLLAKDLEKRKEELEKINSLDKKINLELKSLKEKIKSMQTEMDGFKSEEQLKEEAAERKKELLKNKQKWKKQRDAIKQQVQITSVAYDKRKRELAGNETLKRLDGMEQKLKATATNSFQLQDFIVTQKRESDYQATKNKSMEYTNQINKFIIDQLQG